MRSSSRHASSARCGAAAARVAAAARDTPSIAVLPFVNRSRDEEDEYFSDGLADELLNVLAKIRGLRVAARTSSFDVQGQGRDDRRGRPRRSTSPPLLEGSVRKAGNRVRISVQLVKVADGYHAVVGDLRPHARRHLRGAGRHRAVGGEGAAHDAARREGRFEGERRGEGRGGRGGEGRAANPRRTGSTCRGGSSSIAARRRTRLAASST